MKKIVWLGLLMLVGMTLPGGVLAEDRGRSASPTARQGRIEERTEQREERRSEVAENHANRLEKRFQFYYERMSKIVVRFQARVDLLKNDNKNVASTQTKLDAAKAKLEEAKIKGTAAVAAFRAIDPAKFSEQRNQALAARDLAKEARNLFFEAHKLLKEALKSLKTISKPALPAASPAVNNAL